MTPGRADRSPRLNDVCFQGRKGRDGWKHHPTALGKIRRGLISSRGGQVLIPIVADGRFPAGLRVSQEGRGKSDGVDRPRLGAAVAAGHEAPRIPRGCIGKGGRGRTGGGGVSVRGNRRLK